MSGHARQDAGADSAPENANHYQNKDGAKQNRKCWKDRGAVSYPCSQRIHLSSFWLTVFLGPTYTGRCATRAI